MLNGSQRVEPHIIGVDWGTSSFRAYLLAQDGQVLDQISLPLGILKVANREFSKVLNQACGQWLDSWPSIRILMCGMIGSVNGWHEAHYLHGAVGASELVSRLTTVNGGPSSHLCQIVPGVSGRDFSGGPDVMRGEETLLVGALALGAPRSGYYCLPGTHSKWVNMKDGQISEFSTYVTGEVFSLIKERSILSPLMPDENPQWTDPSRSAFLDGVDMARSSDGLLHQMFSLRARILTDETDATLLSCKLSGLLIGAELLSVKHVMPASVTLVSSGSITTRYQHALRHLDCESTVLEASECCQLGLIAISSA